MQLETCGDPLHVRLHTDAMRLERLTGPCSYSQCACHCGDYIFAFCGPSVLELNLTPLVLEPK